MTTIQSVGKVLRRRPFATACCAIACLLLLGVVFRFGAIDTARTELARVEAEGGQIEKNVRNAANIEEHLSQVKKGVVEFEARLITVDDVSGNQEYFYRLESATGVRLSNPRPLGVPKSLDKNASYRPAGFNVVVEGDYAQVITFLRALEKGTHPYRVTDFTLQRASQQQESSAIVPIVLNLNLELLASRQ
jgi:hypothetical protein